MKNRIVFATGNENKMREIREILSDLGMEIISMKQAGVDPEIVEDGTTFMENAVIKAKAVAALLPDDYVMADDSGLVVDALDGEPGVYSARYMGENTSYDIKNKAIIDRLDGVPKEKRTARFVCAMAAVTPKGKVLEAEGKIEGYIGYEQKGENGFGYDPIFYLYETDMSTAQISPEEKNNISHRGNALREIRVMIEKETGGL